MAPPAVPGNHTREGGQLCRWCACDPARWALGSLMAETGTLSAVDEFVGTVRHLKWSTLIRWRIWSQWRWLRHYWCDWLTLCRGLWGSSWRWARTVGCTGNLYLSMVCDGLFLVHLWGYSVLSSTETHPIVRIQYFGTTLQTTDLSIYAIQGQQFYTWRCTTHSCLHHWNS